MIDKNSQPTDDGTKDDTKEDSTKDSTKDENRLRAQYGHVLIHDMSDLKRAMAAMGKSDALMKAALDEEAAREARKAQEKDTENNADAKKSDGKSAAYYRDNRPSALLSAHYLNTGGETMVQALSSGVFRNMPFHCYDHPYYGIQAVAACSIKAFEKAMREEPGKINPTQTLGDLCLCVTSASRPHAEEYPNDWSESTFCMQTRVLEETGLLLDTPAPNAAPDCLVLCEKTSGLALPVPIGSTINWRMYAGYIVISTYYIRQLGVTRGADYVNLDKDPDEQLLAEEAVATEKYITGLIALAKDPNFKAGTRVDDRYKAYKHQIAQIRSRHAASCA